MFARTSLLRVGFGTLAATTGLGVAYAASPLVTAEAGSTKRALDPDQWIEFELDTVTPVTHDTAKYVFKLEPDQELGLPTASMLLCKAEINGKEIIRPYTPTTLGDTKGHFELIVKTYPEGNMSKHIAELKPGQKLKMQGPIVKYKYAPNHKRVIGLVAGGSGITPMYQVAQEILRNPNDKTKVQMVFANKTEEDIILKDELDALAAKHDNFEVHYVVDSPSFDWEYSAGYVNPEIIKNHLPAPADDALIMVCGPPGMMKAISGDKNKKDFSQGELSGWLKKMGYEKKHVWKF